MKLSNKLDRLPAPKILEKRAKTCSADRLKANCKVSEEPGEDNLCAGVPASEVFGCAGEAVRSFRVVVCEDG